MSNALVMQPHGVPVLFAPGNAGSYRQIRSFAAAAARQYYASPGKPHSRLLAANHQELDFFAGKLRIIWLSVTKTLSSLLP